MNFSEAELMSRRKALLGAIPSNNLRNMIRRTTGVSATYWSAYEMRSEVLLCWDRYADDLRRWCEHTLTGETML